MANRIDAVPSGGAGPLTGSGPAHSSPHRLDWPTRLSYGFGATATGIKMTAFSGYLLLFYNQVIGVPAAIVSTAIAATLVVDALVDPLLGRWSDVVRTRWGRRHPFIYGAAIPTALFFLLTWLPRWPMSSRTARSQQAATAPGPSLQPAASCSKARAGWASSSPA